MRKWILPTPLIFLTIFCLETQTAFSGNYWPLGDGLAWTYRAPGADYSIEMTSYEEGFDRSYDWGSGYSHFTFRENVDGDIEIVGWSYWTQGAFDPDFRTYDPPLLYFDFPLEVGKSWVSMNSSGGLVGEVLREETVTVPAGTFDVMVVKLISLSAQDLVIAGEFYLAPGFGQVIHQGHGLVSFSGTVAVQQLSWGSVKALFR